MCSSSLCSFYLLAFVHHACVALVFSWHSCVASVNKHVRYRTYDTIYELRLGAEASKCFFKVSTVQHIRMLGNLIVPYVCGCTVCMRKLDCTVHMHHGIYIIFTYNINVSTVHSTTGQTVAHLPRQCANYGGHACYVKPVMRLSLRGDA